MPSAFIFKYSNVTKTNKQTKKAYNNVLTKPLLDMGVSILSSGLSLEDLNSDKFHGFYLLRGVSSDLANHNRITPFPAREQIITDYP